MTWVAGAGLLALALALALTPLMARLACAAGLVSVPSADRWSTRTTPKLGGLAIGLAALVASLVVALVGVPVDPVLLWAGGGALAMLLVGLLDDLRRLSARAKLAAQTLAAVALAVVVVREGLPRTGGGLTAWPVLVGILAVCWLVGITNALNLLDHIDGAAGGIAAIAGGFLAVQLALNGDRAGAGAALGLGGAALGFLVYNFHPARIFMGDSGSLFLGFGLGALALRSVLTAGGGACLAAPDAGCIGPLTGAAAALAVPVLDTGLVAIARPLHGRSPFQGGTDHSSHRLVRLGFSTRRAVPTLYVLALVYGAAGLLAQALAPLLQVAVVALLALGLALIAYALYRVPVYGK